MPAMSSSSRADGGDISHERSDLGDNEVVTTGLLDLRSFKSTQMKQQGANKSITMGPKEIFRPA
jgi:hypothetical protein